jgi:hypothetical protein
MSMDTLWLPEGDHWNLHIEHHRLTGAGAFNGGGWKLTWHTTESKQNSFEAIRDLFIQRDANGVGSEPHFLIGFEGKRKHPNVCQFLPLNRAARTLQHPSGTPETNRCNNIQIEVCGNAAESGEWPENYYKALANLVVLIEHRRPIVRRVARAFDVDKRFTGGQFVLQRGHLGHKHAANQPDNHGDPGDGFRGDYLLSLCEDAPHKL